MPILHNSVIPAAADSTPAEDPVTRSLLKSASTQKLVRTPSGGDTKTWTMAFWVKKHKNGLASQTIASAYDGSAANSMKLEFHSDDKIIFHSGGAVGQRSQGTNTRVFRDPSSWYHLCLVLDATLSTGTDRLKLWVNGEPETMVGMNSINYYPSENATSLQWNGNWENTIFGTGNDGHLSIADFYFLDGHTVSTPVDNFIESNDYGGYKPKDFDMSSYGGNSWHLDMQPQHDADLLVTSVDRKDGDTLFADCAGHTLTKSGDPEHSIAVGNPFTSTGRAIDFGTDDSNYLEIWDGSTGDYNIGSDDFTMEAWYNTYDTEPYGALFGHYQDANNWFNLYVYGDKLRWYYKISGSGLAMVSDVDWQHHKWNHVAVTKSGSAHKLWLNGVQVATGTKSGSNTFSASAPLHVGTLRNSSTSFADYHGDGYVYDARISSSIRYTSDFDVPTAKFTDDSDTELLLQPDNSDSDWDDVDKSHNSHGVTEYGTVTRTASTPYDAAAKSSAIHFDGSGDYLQTSTSSDLTFGTGDFTVETWFYPTTVDTSTSYKGIISDELYSDTGGWALSQRDDELSLWIKNTGGSWVSFVADGALTANQWQHIAVSYDSSTTTTRLFVDGTSVVSGTTSGWNLTGDQVEIGRSVSGQEIAGYLFDVRATKGTARYTSNFTAPSAPFELNPVYIGGDQSGNKNHFTPTNISMHDVILDTPTKNYATINVLHSTGAVTAPVSEGNLKIYANTYSGGNYEKIPATIPIPTSGKWYVEFYAYAAKGAGNISSVGVVRQQDGTWGSSSGTNYGLTTGNGFDGIAPNIYGNNMSLRSDGVGVDTDSGGTLNNSAYICALAIDVDNGKIYGGYESGGAMTWMNSGDPTSGSTGTGAVSRTFSSDDLLAIEVVVSSNNTNGSGFVVNFGQDPTFAGNKTSGQDTSQSEFYYAPPTGFKSLNTSNLDAPIVTPEENFAAKAYEGEGGGEEINLGFTPALTWIKRREDSGYWHGWYDSNRGLSAGALASNSTNSEDSTQRVASFDSNAGSEGFTLASSHYSYTNTSGKDFISWNWKAHQTPSASASYSDTLTLTVSDYMSGETDGWGNTKLKVYEGTAEIGEVGQPTTDDGSGNYSNEWDIKTNDPQKIKLVWDCDSDFSDWYNIDVSLDDDSGSNLQSYYYDEYDSSTEFSDGDVFYQHSSYSTANESTAGTVVAGGGATVSSNSERYNSAAGFTMFTYTGNSDSDDSTMLFNHTLGVPLDFAICKNRDATGNWLVWHKDLGDASYQLFLNSSTNVMYSNNTSGSDSVGWFTNKVDGAQHQAELRNIYWSDDSGSSGQTRPVKNSDDFVFYGWAGVESHSKFGKVVGNGDSSDGVFCYLGFRPALIIMKNITHSSGFHWRMWDSARGSHNVNDEVLYPSSSLNESTSDGHIDFLSNGFKLRSSAGNLASDYIYAAFAESPFKYANAK